MSALKAPAKTGASLTKSLTQLCVFVALLLQHFGCILAGFNNRALDAITITVPADGLQVSAYAVFVPSWRSFWHRSLTLPGPLGLRTILFHRA